MLDIDFQKIKFPNDPAVPLLILESGDINPYCAIIKEWSAVIKELNKETYTLDYSRLYQEYGHRGLEKYIRGFLDKKKIGAIYFQNIFLPEFDLGFIEDLRQDYFIFSYLPDTFEHFQRGYRYLAQVLDLVLTESYFDKFRYKAYGVDSLFLLPSYDPRIYRGLGTKSKTIDVSFVGRLDRIDRKEYLDFLRNASINIEVFGIGSEHGPLSKQEMIEVFNKSKINLNFSALSGVFSNKIESRIKQYKGRCCEIALTNSFVLTEYAPDTQLLFDIGSEVGVFYNKHDLLEKIRFYLQNEQKRETVAGSGYQRALRDYDSRKVWKELWGLIALKMTEKKYRAGNIYIGNDFLHLLNAHRSACLYMLLKAGKMKFAYELLLKMIRSKKFSLLQLFYVLCRITAKDFFNRHPRIKKFALRFKPH